jgi:adenylate cyclase
VSAATSERSRPGAIGRLASIGNLSSDPPEERLRKQTLARSAALMAGVIGRTKSIHDLRDDIANTLRRMESHGIPGQIQLTEGAALRVVDRFEVRERGEIDVNGKGAMRTYLRLASKDSRA